MCACIILFPIMAKKRCSDNRAIAQLIEQKKEGREDSSKKQPLKDVIITVDASVKDPDDIPVVGGFEEGIQIKDARI